MNFLRRLFGNTKPVPPSRQMPPAPSDWRLTIDDLMREMKEGKRKSIGSPEVDWARDYERSLLLSSTRFPKQGDVYSAIEDMEVSYMTAWRAPFTGGGKTTIRRGERFWIDSAPSSQQPISVYAVAMRYDALELEVIPAVERENPKYNGYYFSFKTEDLNTRFHLVDENYQKEKIA